jgi:hypothetical protein
MKNRNPNEPDPESLPEPIAERLLARASELDAAQSGPSVADLRAAAAEAGISTRAFDQALAEIQATRRVPEGSRRTRRWRLIAAVVALLAGGALTVSRTFGWGGSSVAPAMVEEVISLRCLSGGDAAELIRPLLKLPENTVYSTNNSQVLRIRATAEQMQQVKALLDKNEAAESPACNARKSEQF